MNTTTDTTATQPQQPTEADVMKIAAEADAAEDAGTTVATTPAKPAPQEKKDGTPPAEGESADKPGETAGKDAAEKPDDKKQAGEETTFAKAKKEAERKDRSWKALEADKEEFRQNRARIESEVVALRRELSELRTRAAKPAEPAKDKHGLTAADYDRMAKDFETKGSDELAQEAKERAEELRKKTPAIEAAAPAGEPWKSPEFQSEWQRNVQALIQSDATLADPKNPVVVSAQNLVNDPRYSRFFRAHPDGIRAAVEVAQLMRTSAEVPELKKQLTTAQEQTKKDRAEIERLNGLLQPRGSHPSGPPAGAKKLEEMSDADAEAFVRQAAAAADRGES